MNITSNTYLYGPAIRNAIILIASLFIMQTTTAQSLAGKVVFAQGTPSAVNTAGAQRSLARGNDIFSGDRLITSNGRLQISMLDGAFVSVQPNSEYQIENYNYSGTPDGTEIANYRLVKGGVRAVTGLIGRQNPEAYKVNTAVATIGIRGTGHNTRICAGDCGSRPDGLYHQTWEGITFVVNDVDTQDVPTGMGVYVADIDTDIEVLDQPPAVLAVDTTRERQEEELEEAEEQAQVVSVGEQRDESGDQLIIADSRGSSTVLAGIGILGVTPDETEPSNSFVFGFEFGSSVFRRDSDGQGVAILGLEADEDETNLNTLATIDVAAVRGGNNQTEVNFANSLLDLAAPALLTSLEENPASAADFFFNEEIGFGRWFDGRVLVVHNAEFAEDNEIIELSGNQSIHYIFGTEPPLRPTAGEASYEFFGGTQSTSSSGNSIGQGVTSGTIHVDFLESYASLDMDVEHDNVEYFVSGTLGFYPDGSLRSFGSELNNVFANGGDCDGCLTNIEAGFAGSAVQGFAKYIALEYDIQALDVIMGVAAFGFEPPPPPPPPPPPTTTVLTNSVFIAISPDTESLDGVDSIGGFEASLFFDGTELVGLLFSDDDDEVGLLRVSATIDVDSVLAGDDAASVAEVQALLAAADQAQIDIFEANTPATYTDSAFFPDGFGWGRWTNGFILATDDGDLIDSTEAANFPGNQSVHIIFGQDPGLIATSGSAFYEFFGGTRSTSASGATIGNGVKEGFISVDFGTGTGAIAMEVDHIAGFPYTVAGSLGLSSTNNEVFDNNSVVAITTDPTSSCFSVGCTTFIEGGFAGPSTFGPPNVPDHLGIEYDIQDTDVVMGVAGFHYVDVAPLP